MVSKAPISLETSHTDLSAEEFLLFFKDSRSLKHVVSSCMELSRPTGA